MVVKRQARADRFLEAPRETERMSEVLKSTEDAHIRSMSTFEADEHLQAPPRSGDLACPAVRLPL
jgi:hypothetical protein